MTRTATEGIAMTLGPGWMERTTSNEFARIFDHEAGYVVLGILEEDGNRRWDLARGRGRLSRIVSERPFGSMLRAIQEAERLIAENGHHFAALDPQDLLRAG